jgi:hypothetical protein
LDRFVLKQRELRAKRANKKEMFCTLKAIMGAARRDWPAPPARKNSVENCRKPITSKAHPLERKDFGTLRKDSL